MKLIIDANILISALINTEGKTYDLIFNKKIKLFAPEYLNEKTNKYKNEILLKSRLSEKEFNLFLSLLCSKINFVPNNGFSYFINEARKITTDENDIEYFALVLKIKCRIWSNDKKLKEQNEIEVYSTKELVELF